MDRVFKLFIIFVGLWIAMPFVHEALHYVPAYFFGLEPSFDFSDFFNVWRVWHTTGPTWVNLIVRHMPELTFLLIAAPLTWKFRMDWALMLVLPFLGMAIMGFGGHVGYW